MEEHLISSFEIYAEIVNIKSGKSSYSSHPCLHEIRVDDGDEDVFLFCSSRDVSSPSEAEKNIHENVRIKFGAVLFEWLQVLLVRKMSS
jgi:hypothetical protein